MTKHAKLAAICGGLTAEANRKALKSSSMSRNAIMHAATAALLILVLPLVATSSGIAEQGSTSNVGDALSTAHIVESGEGLSPIAEDETGTKARLAYKTVVVTIEETSEGDAVVAATSLFRSGGYRSPRLVRMYKKQPPVNGIYDFQMVADPPTAGSTSQLTKLTATLQVNLPGFMGARVHSETNSVVATLPEDDGWLAWREYGRTHVFGPVATRAAHPRLVKVVPQGFNPRVLLLDLDMATTLPYPPPPRRMVLQHSVFESSNPAYTKVSVRRGVDLSDVPIVDAHDSPREHRWVAWESGGGIVRLEGLVTGRIPSQLVPRPSESNSEQLVVDLVFSRCEAHPAVRVLRLGYQNVGQRRIILRDTRHRFSTVVPVVSAAASTSKCYVDSSTALSSYNLDRNSKLGATWLHVRAKRWNHTFDTQQQVTAWTTRTRDPNSAPVRVGRIYAHMYGFWNDGNRTTQAEAENASFVQTSKTTQRCTVGPIPFPCTSREGVTGTARSWRPNIGPIKAGIN